MEKLSLEGNIGVLPRAQTLNPIYIQLCFPQLGVFRARRRVPETRGFCAWGAARTGRVWPHKYFVLDQELLLKWLSPSAQQILLWFSECANWIPFRWNSAQKMCSRSIFNALGWLLGTESAGAKQSQPTAMTSSHYRRSPIVPNDLLT